MERHILTWSSGGNDKTAVAITKLTVTSDDLVGEVIYAGTDEGAIILEELLHSENYKAEQKELQELRLADKRRRERTIRKVEKALGITLYEWQKDFIFHNKHYGAAVSQGRQTGKTLAHCLRLCLSDGEPLNAILVPPVPARNEFLKYLGEDGCTVMRSRYFISELRKVYEQLRAAGGIDLREISFTKV